MKGKKDLKNSLKKLARDLGVSLFGVASVDRFEGAPPGHHPEDWLPTVKSIISFGIQIPVYIHAYERLLYHPDDRT